MHLLLLVGHLLGHGLVVLTLAEVAAEALLEILLLVGQAFGFVGDIAHLRTGLCTAHGLHGLLGLLQTFGGALGFRLARRGLLRTLLAGLTRGSGIAHVALGLFEIPDRVIELLLLAAAHRVVAGERRRLLLLLSLLTALLLTVLSRLLAGLPGLPALSRLLTLLSLLAALLTLLALLLGIL